MRSEALERTIKTLLADLKACSNIRSLEKGKEIHAHAVEIGIDSCLYVANSLVSMYAKCRSMRDARQVFDSIRSPNVVSWTALILGYAENGEGVTALNFFSGMKSQGFAPNSITFVAAIKACTSLALQRDGSGNAHCRERGRQLHSEIGSFLNKYVQNSLIDMYAKCGDMADAQKVFDGMKYPDVVSWNALILGYADNGKGVTALDLFTRMKSQGFVPNFITIIAALKSCTSFALEQDRSGRVHCRERGRQIHSEIGLHSNAYVQATLIDMYAKCGSMVDARQVFDNIKCPSVALWNILILGYAENGEGATALDIFSRMKSHGWEPNTITFVAALKACTALAPHQSESGRAECRELGLQIHAEIGDQLNIHVQNALIAMYVKYGNIVDAHQVFSGIKHPDVVSWNTLILGYAENGGGYVALDLFERMKFQGCAPTSITFIAALKACISLALKRDGIGREQCIEHGKKIHSEIGCHLNAHVQNTLVDMYAKCGSMIDARHVFDDMKHPDVAAWNTLIFGYVDNGEGDTSLNIFTKMRSQGIPSNSITFVAALKACSSVGALEYGSKIHAQIHTEIAGAEINATILVTCLVDFYAKCGCLLKAKNVFDSNPRARDLKTWTALLAGYSCLGHDKAAFGLFEGMQDAGFQPDGVTFLCILMCCSHAGLVQKAKEFFQAMLASYGIVPTVEHYNCMLDILGRSNKLDDAIALLQKMPCKPDGVTWMTILAACRKWKNVEIGTMAFKSLLNLDDKNPAAYVLMSHIYRSRGMLKEQDMVLGMRKEKAGKEPGQSFWTNEAGEVHRFLVGDRKHPQTREIQQNIKAIVATIRTRSDLQCINRTDEEALCDNSEMLALTCALINTKAGETIRIVMNLRVCDHSHSTILLISKIDSRTITCRDAYKLHVFKDGTCSCGDF